MIGLMSLANILKKGFAIIKQDNKIINYAGTIQVGSEIDIILSDTAITATVTQKNKCDGDDFNV